MLRALYLLLVLCRIALFISGTYRWVIFLSVSVNNVYMSVSLTHVPCCCARARMHHMEMEQDSDVLREGREESANNTKVGGKVGE